MAQRGQVLQVLLGFLDLALHQVGLADVFMRAQVRRVDGQRTLVMLERLIEPA